MATARRTLMGRNRDEEPGALQWGRNHPVAAQACLQRPEPRAARETITNNNNKEPGRPLGVTSWEDYFAWRNWDFSAAAILDDGHDVVHAQALVTHILSDPVTLAHLLFWSKGGPMIQKWLNDDDACSDPSSCAHHHVVFKCCCLGARAESMIPVEYWRELLIMYEHCLLSALLNKGRFHNGIPWLPSIQISIDFVGPDMALHPPTTLTLPSRSALQLRWLYKGKFHDYCSSRKKMNEQESSLLISSSSSSSHDYDAYILLNPGLGHANLRDDWSPTLDLVLGQNRKEQLKKTCVLLTAHSKLDADRDWARLRAYQQSTGLVGSEHGDDLYQVNPFASRIVYQDPFDAHHFVRPNHFYHILQ
jgi:hypothetical protein